jgi:biotin carboxylase
MYQVDIKNNVECIGRASELYNDGVIHGVYTQGCDCDYQVSAIADECGFKHNTSITSAEACYDKVINREALQPINPVKYVMINNLDNIDKVLDKIDVVGYPCIVKPINNSASRGVTKIYNKNKNDILLAIKEAFNNTYHNDNYIIIEELLSGVEYSVDTIVYNNVLYPCGISDRVFIESKDRAIQKGSMTPSMLPTDIQQKLYEIMDRARVILGVNQTAFKGDLIITDEGEIRIIEVTCRTSGGFDSQYRKPLSFGIDMLKFTIQMAMGDDPQVLDLVPKWFKWSMTTSVFPQEGVVTSTGNWDAVLKIDGVKYATTSLNVGDIIEYKHCASRVNHVIIQADTYQDLIKLESKVQKTLKIEVDPK